MGFIMENNYYNKKILVVGLGTSGIAVAKLLDSCGSKVVATDTKTTKELAHSIEKLNEKIEIIPDYRNSGKSKLTNKLYDMLVISPGVPPEDPLIEWAKKRGIKIMGELEVAYSMLPAGTRTVAVTGTNGKTTTVELIKRLLSANEGRKTIAAGNIGLPLSACINRIKNNVDLVMEVSSYQLERMEIFHPYISAILNITPDHLEHHGTMKKYIYAKSKIFRLQKGNDVCIINADNKYCAGLAERIKCRVVLFSREKQLAKGIYLQGDKIICDMGFVSRTEYRISSGFIRIPGPHNIENVMVAIAVSSIFGMRKPSIEKIISSFKGVEHRIEFVREIDNIRFINDSKSTNVDSCLTALNAFEDNIILIMGGRDKGAPYSPLKKQIAQKVKELIVLGEASAKIAKELKGAARLHKVNNMRQAVVLSHKLAKPGFTVLLSPACASFDQFRNYEHRGKVFKQWVKKL